MVAVWPRQSRLGPSGSIFLKGRKRVPRNIKFNIFFDIFFYLHVLINTIINLMFKGFCSSRSTPIDMNWSILGLIRWFLLLSY